MDIQLVQGDITKLHVDAIVNAANNRLLGGGGVDGAIHRAAGKELLEACKPLKGCATGKAKITKGFRLPAHYVIHTVGPIYAHHSVEEAAELLHSAYYESLKLAEKFKCNTLAFPNISTGVYGYPKIEAARIAINAVKGFAKGDAIHLKQLIFCCFDTENFLIYQEILNT